MSRKRSLQLMHGFQKHKKRNCRLRQESTVPNIFNQDDSTLVIDIPNDTKSSLLFMKALCPKDDRFQCSLPAIILKHQLYSIITCRTTVDKQLGELRSSGEIRLFKLSLSDEDEYGIVFTDEYIEYIKRRGEEMGLESSIVEKFCEKVLKKCADVSLDRKTLTTSFEFSEAEIKKLVQCSILTVRDVGSWWLAIPALGAFIKSFLLGRKAVLSMIRKTKYKEILQTELEQRKLPKPVKLGMKYHLHDIMELI